MCGAHQRWRGAVSGRTAEQRRRASAMPDDDTYGRSYDLEENELEDDGILATSDALDGDLSDDPLDTGIIPADRWSAGEGFGTTLAEERAGESLDQLLAEEEPGLDPYAEAEPPPADPVLVPDRARVPAYGAPA